MGETLAVRAEEVRLVAAALEHLALSPAAPLGTLARMYVDIAQQACARMLSGADAAGGILPPDPVSGLDQAAIALHEMMASFERGGFSHEEAFGLTVIQWQATATGNALRGPRGA